LAEWARPFIDAFWLLSAGRPHGFAPGGIPTADILAFWNTFHIGPDAWEFLELVRAMDSAFIEHHAKQQPASHK